MALRKRFSKARKQFVDCFWTIWELAANETRLPWTDQEMAWIRGALTSLVRNTLVFCSPSIAAPRALPVQSDMRDARSYPVGWRIGYDRAPERNPLRTQRHVSVSIRNLTACTSPSRGAR